MSFVSQRYVYKHWPKRMAAASLDAVGGFLSAPFRRRAVTPVRFKKILIVRLDQIGDAVMTRPAIKALKEHFPEAEIDVLASEQTAPLFRATSGVREVLVFKDSWLSAEPAFIPSLAAFQGVAALLHSKKYDLAIDFRGDLRNIALTVAAGIPFRAGFGITGGGFLLTHEGVFSRDLHQAELNFKLLSVLGVRGKLARQNRFDYSTKQKDDFLNRFPDLATASPRIVVHPGANYASKRWPPAKFKELISKITRENLGRVILVGAETEKNLLSIDGWENITDLRGLTRIEELAILFDLCDVFIGNDSGPAHIAAAQNLELVLLASGTNDIRYWHPWTDRLHIVQHTVPCSPCEARECPLGHHDCMEKISVSHVMEVLQGILQKRKMESPLK